MATQKPYTAKDVSNPVAAAKGGPSMRPVAYKYGIPPTTLHDHVSGKRSKVGAGGPTIMTYAEEREIALTCMALADMGYGSTRNVVAGIVHDYLCENAIPDPFTGGFPRIGGNAS